MRISDWSSDVCSSDLSLPSDSAQDAQRQRPDPAARLAFGSAAIPFRRGVLGRRRVTRRRRLLQAVGLLVGIAVVGVLHRAALAEPRVRLVEGQYTAAADRKRPRLNSSQ